MKQLRPSPAANCSYLNIALPHKGIRETAIVSDQQKHAAKTPGIFPVAYEFYVLWLGNVTKSINGTSLIETQTF